MEKKYYIWNRVTGEVGTQNLTLDEAQRELDKATEKNDPYMPKEDLEIGEG